MFAYIKKTIQHAYFASTQFSFYTTIRLQHFTETLKYFFFLVMILTVITSVRLYMTAHRIGRDLAAVVEKQIPSFQIKKGSLEMSSTTPVQISYHGFFFIIDPSGAIKTVPPEALYGVILLPDRLIIKRNIFTSESVELKMFHDFTFDPAVTARVLRAHHILLFFALMLFVLVFTFIGRLLFVMLAAPFSYALQSSRKQAIPFQQHFNMLVYALTPCMIVSGLLAVSDRVIPYQFTVSFLMYICFIWGAFSHLTPPREE